MATKSLQMILDEVTELKQRAAINDAIANFLRTGYVGRDSMPAQKQLACDGAPIPETLVAEVAQEFTEYAKEQRQTAKQTLGVSNVQDR